MPETWADKTNVAKKTAPPTVNNKSIIVITVVCVVALLIVLGLVLGLSIGLTRKNNSDKNDVKTTTTSNLATDSIETIFSTSIVEVEATTATTITSASKTTATRKPCKNAAMYDPATDKCMCKEFTSGEYCETVANCEDLPDDYEGCEYLSQLEDIDKEEFAAYCPKTAFCTVKPSPRPRKIMEDTKFHLCQNYGTFDFKTSHCSCLAYTYGEFCEHIKSCDEIDEDLKECEILKERRLLQNPNLIPYCPKTCLC